jgi:galactonate dehydratase
MGDGGTDDVKITGVRIFKYWVHWRNWVFVRLETDEGLYGWGEASLHGTVEAVEAAVQELTRTLVGHDPAGVEGHWQRMYHAWRWRGGPILMTALAALDCALWDIEGKRLGVPVYRLFGGPTRERIRAYASHWLEGCDTPEKVAAGAREAARRGFTMFKWTPGTLRPDAMRRDERGAIARAAELMAAAREAAGEGMEIAVECAEFFTHRTAVLAGKALAPYRPYWLEEPLPFENPKAMARLKGELPVPLATGERLCSKWEFRELVELGGADVLQPDLIHAGGISEVRRIAALADTYYLPVAPHNSSGPIANLLSVHLAASIPNFLVLEEIEAETELRDALCTHPLRLEAGHFPLPAEPGIGTDLKLEVLEAAGEAHRYRPQPSSRRTEPPRY